MKNVLIVEDDDCVREDITDILTGVEYTVFEAKDQCELLQKLEETNIDVIILDINLGKENGYDICKNVRLKYDTPILFLTAQNGEMDLVKGFNSGGDDYLTKPFRVMELIARVSALSRRYNNSKKMVYESADLSLNIESFQLFKSNIVLDLTLNEIKIIKELMDSWPSCKTRSSLLYDIWDKDSRFIDENTLNVNISRLREKLGKYEREEYFKTIRGVGYMWSFSVKMKIDFYYLILCISIIGNLALITYIIISSKRIEYIQRKLDEFLFNKKQVMDSSDREGIISNLQNDILKIENMVIKADEDSNKREQQLIQFAENLVHQIKTMITSIQIRTELAIISVGDKQISELEKSMKAISRLTEEVDRLLTMSLLASHKLNLKYENADVTMCLNEVISSLEPLASKKSILLESTIAEQVKANVDIFWIREVFVNLIKNAIEHGDADGIVQISLDNNSRGFKFKVKNRGHIDFENGTNIFERFNTTTTAGKGYGIGLSMCKDIVELHHGEIRLINDDGKNIEMVVNITNYDGVKPYNNVIKDKA